MLLDHLKKEWLLGTYSQDIYETISFLFTVKEQSPGVLLVWNPPPPPLNSWREDPENL